MKKMTRQRTTILSTELVIVLITLSVILMITLIAFTIHYRSEVNSLTAINDGLKNAGVKSDQVSSVDENKLAQAAAENRDLSSQIARLKEQISQLEDQLSEAQAGLAITPDNLEQQIIDSLAANSAALEPIVPELAAPANPGRNRGQNLSPEQRAQFQERMREGMDRMRNRLAEDLNAEMQKTSDPAAQERLAQIQQYTDYNLDLFQQLRDASTDEQRAALRQELAESQNYISSLRQEQQNYMLNEIAKQFGVADQENFINSIRDTMRSPMFRGNPGSFGGGSRGGFGGGFGTGRGPGNRGQQ